ncbi:hypothetical protein NOR_05182 [Metarhizium rileyi]|uniref:Uncharacterized protein n=1 Tax=Metarhizium rileyi (strain RCEF 4871) TaxID=1649241 RepID=A0A167CWV7_METRR|nr:hypothetical protein NOR_05182 [Metarhizium rileyi RCEF 4871]
MSLRLFLVESLGFPRNHHAIFVENAQRRGGHIFQVTGNIQEGMRYEMKVTEAAPEKDPSQQGRTYLGCVSASNIPLIDALCKSIPAPEKQFEGARKITVLPIRRCQEWTIEALGLLKEKGVLVSDGSTATK